MPADEKGSKVFNGRSLLNPRNRLHGNPCSFCKIPTCDSIHGPPAHDCHLKDSYGCADLAAVDDEISDAYHRLFNLVQKREQIIKKTYNNPSIERVPAEMLSLIFRFVKDTYNNNSSRPMFSQPHHSPPLLVGAVCNKWRQVSLQTPHLWTDIILDLGKPADGALNMVNEWARRAGALSLNLTIFLDSDDYIAVVPKEAGVLIKALRSLAVRWNNVALQTPWTFYEDLLTELEEAPQIVSFYAQVTIDVQDITITPIKLQHPLRPKYLYIQDISGIEIPFKWDNLVHLKIYNVQAEELLQIIRRAQKLEHCDATCLGQESDVYHIPTTYITNLSLIHFRALARHGDIVGSLTLPSLQHLEYMTSRNPQFDSLVQFVERSSPPLHTFILRCEIQPGAPELPFKKLPGITNLSVLINGDNEFRVRDKIDQVLWTLTKPSFRNGVAILPSLKELALDLPLMSRESWTLLGRLFRKDIQDNHKEVLMCSIAVNGRPLSKLRIVFANDFAEPMAKATFLHLLAVKKLGMDVDVRLRCGVDFFSMMAELHHVRL